MALKMWLSRNGFDALYPEDAKGIFQVTPLMEAARLGFDEICKLLLFEIGVKSSKTRDKRGRMAIHYAADAGWLSIVKLLIDHDELSLNEVDKDGSTCLRLAAGRGHLKIVVFLLERMTTDVIQRANTRGSSPLEFSIEEGFMKVSELLILSGATNKYTSNSGDIFQGHVDVNIVNKVYKKMATTLFHNHVNEDLSSSVLLRWGMEQLATHSTFVSVVVMAILCEPIEPSLTEEDLECDLSHTDHKRSKYGKIIDTHDDGGVKAQVCLLPKLAGSIGLILLIASYAGVQFGRKLRNVREFTSCLKSIHVHVSSWCIKQENVNSSDCIEEMRQENDDNSVLREDNWGDMHSPSTSLTTQSKRIHWSPM